ncbi:Alkaline phosphatase, partial [hydrothermal vent metagenome]
NLSAQNVTYEPIEINNLKTQISNVGSIEQINFEESAVQYSSGFYLSGKMGEVIWGNGVFPSVVGMADFLPGNVNSDPNGSKNKIYVVESSDLDFGASWQEWKDAVELGALYYDGNNDGIYDPVDLNGNDSWDPEEDKPDIIGDYTAWSVYNDSKLSSERLYSNVTPKGIEIRQTVFGYNLKHDDNLSNTIFVRYIIENKGNISEQFDSVYFGPVMDPDIGSDYNKDYVGCDTLLNAVFAYKKSKDNDNGYGNNPPSIASALLQGPHAYIPGVTFIDNNSNGIYDDGVDTALDTAEIHRGELLGIKYIPGAKNLTMNSSTSLLKSHPSLDTPDNEIQQMNYSIGGMFANGDPIVVSELNIGNGAELGDAANSIPPEFMFSGDPVTKEGWLLTTEWDYRAMLSSGPFKLSAGDAVEVITSYNVGRSDSALSSVVAAKEITKNIIEVYDRNFTNIPVDVKRKENIPSEFSLAQNYPNPFNPTTTIKYSITTPPQPFPSQGEGVSKGFVTLKVYDILGREVATLVNKAQKSGNYEVQFDASDLTSGVYFYKLNVYAPGRAGGFVETKKMLLLR